MVHCHCRPLCLLDLNTVICLKATEQKKKVSLVDHCALFLGQLYFVGKSDSATLSMASPCCTALRRLSRSKHVFFKMIPPPLHLKMHCYSPFRLPLFIFLSFLFLLHRHLSFCSFLSPSPLFSIAPRWVHLCSTPTYNPFFFIDLWSPLPSRPSPLSSPCFT